MMRKLSGRRHGKLPVAMLALGLLVAACGSGGGSGSGSGDAGAQASSPREQAKLLGPAKPAKGTPVRIGFVTDGKGVNVDFTSAQRTAQAAVKYVNKHLGGVAGHPIELFVCETKQVPANASDCANRMVEEKVPVVLNDVNGVGSVVVPPITAAGIPYLTFSGTTVVELTTKGAYSVTGSISSLGGIAEYYKEQGVKKTSALTIDVPGATQSLHTVAKPAFAKAGIALEEVLIPPGTPDLTPQMQRAVSGHADAVMIIGDKTLCSAGLKAARTLAYTGKLYISQQCIDPAAVASVPDGYEGVEISSVTNKQDGDKEYELYKAVLQKYEAENAQADIASGTALQGYGAVLAFARAMASVTSGDLTPDRVMTALSSARKVPLPLGGGSTFSCDGSAAPKFRSICSVTAKIGKLGKDGRPTSYKPVNPASLFR